MARRRTAGDEVEAKADFTPMLDLIFNVLAFFVITFNPPKPEKNFDVTLPPPQKQEETKSTSELPSEEPQIYESVTIGLRAGPGGALQSVQLEGRDLGGGTVAVNRLVNDLRRHAAMLNVPGQDKGALEVATIVSDSALKYEHLIMVVDACYQASIKKINFAEAPSSSGPGG